VTSVPLSPDSLLARAFPRADYVDAFAAPVRARDLTPEDVFRSFFRSAPAWVMVLMDLRNRLVARLGLKATQGATSAGERERILRDLRVEPGTSVGLFKIYARAGGEVMAGEDDKHLDFRVSVFIGETGPDGTRRLTLGTVVRLHNALGRLYFVAVRPFHRIIVPVMLKGMVRDLEAGAARARE
jgi:hypothetical protein